MQHKQDAEQKVAQDIPIFTPTADVEVPLMPEVSDQSIKRKGGEFRILTGLARLLEGTGVCAAVAVLPHFSRSSSASSSSGGSEFCIALNEIFQGGTDAKKNTSYINEIMSYFKDVAEARSPMPQRREKLLGKIFSTARKAAQRQQKIYVDDEFFQRAVEATLLEINPCLFNPNIPKGIPKGRVHIGLEILSKDGRTKDYMFTYGRLARLYVDFIRLEKGIIEASQKHNYSSISQETLQAFQQYNESCILTSETENVHAEMQILARILEIAGLLTGQHINIQTSKLLCFDCDFMIQKTRTLLQSQGITITTAKSHGMSYDWHYPHRILVQKDQVSKTSASASAASVAINIETKLYSAHSKAKAPIKIGVRRMETPDSSAPSSSRELDIDKLRESFDAELKVLSKHPNTERAKNVQLSISLCGIEVFKSLLQRLHNGDIPQSIESKVIFDNICTSLMKILTVPEEEMSLRNRVHIFLVHDEFCDEHLAVQLSDFASMVTPTIHHVLAEAAAVSTSSVAGSSLAPSSSVFTSTASVVSAEALPLFLPSGGPKGSSIQSSSDASTLSTSVGATSVMTSPAVDSQRSTLS